MENLPIKSRGGNYSVYFTSSIQDTLSHIEKLSNASFVVDSKVYELYPNIKKFLAHKNFLLLDATEEEKTWEGVGRTISWYQKSNLIKSSQVVAIGGGIIQDIVCFSTSVYYRGINWHFIPTTVLSMTDSCIGAKCGININQFKNQVGSFHSPKGVYINLDFVNTLDDKDVQSGYGEILKLALTGPQEFYTKLKSTLAKHTLRSPELLNLIKESLIVKKAVIEEDEFESDYRRVLNYGHTFGHSLETITDHYVPHGLAVAWGIDIINFLSWKMGLISEEVFFDIHRFIDKYLSFRLKTTITAQELINGTRRDKKAIGNGVNLVLLNKIGSLKIVRTEYDEKMHHFVEQYLKEFNVFPCP